ncbi:hypothetical protein NDU88_004468, partial [Pleurodeles waltl]
RLSHPNIVGLMAITKTSSSVLIASGYMHGASLNEVLYRAECPVKLLSADKFYVGLEISMAIEYIHSKNILHQDIKPANIL